jgi:glycogen phosphorylase
MQDTATRLDASLIESPPLGDDTASLAADFRRYFTCTLGRDKFSTSSHYLYEALALTLRDRLTERWNRTRHAYELSGSRQVCYLSLEYLIGRSLDNALLNLGLRETVAEALASLGLELADVLEQEQDAGLGNGGLGRLAA